MFALVVDNLNDGIDDEQVLRIVQNVSCQSSYMRNMLQTHSLPGPDQQPASNEEQHDPVLEVGSALGTQQTDVSTDKRDQAAEQMLRLVPIPGGIHNLGGSVAEADQAALASSSGNSAHRCSVVSL